RRVPSWLSRRLTQRVGQVDHPSETAGLGSARAVLRKQKQGQRQSVSDHEWLNLHCFLTDTSKRSDPSEQRWSRAALGSRECQGSTQNCRLPVTTCSRYRRT